MADQGRETTRPVMTPLHKLEAPVTGDSPPRTGGMVPEGRGTTVRVEPEWPLLTTFSVNLLSLPTHQHGPNGPHYLTHDQAVNMLHACIKAMSPPARTPTSETS